MNGDTLPACLNYQHSSKRLFGSSYYLRKDAYRLNQKTNSMYAQNNQKNITNKFFRLLSFLSGFLLLFCFGTAQANFSFGEITQSPENNVWPIQPVTYTVQVSSSTVTGPFSITITGSSESDITGQFFSPDCDLSNAFDCRITSTDSFFNFQFTWTPPPNSTAIIFHLGCNFSGCSTGAPVTVITTTAPPPESNIIRTTLTDTQRAIAKTLDKLCTDTLSETLKSQCSTLSSLNDSEISIALNQIAPDEVTAQGSSSISVTTTQLTNVRSRLASLRNGPPKTRFAMKGIMLAMNGDTLPAGLLADSSDVGSDLSSLIKNSRLGVFMSGRINFGEKDSTSRETGFDFETQGITAGLDYWHSSKLVFGGALGYADTQSDFNFNGGSLNSTSLSAAFYGSYYLREDAYIDWITTVGNNSFNTRRTIIYSGVDTLTHGNTDGKQLGLSTTAAFDYRIGKLLISPYVRLDYVNAEIKGYQETGGSGLALAIAKQKTKSFSSAIATRISQAFSQSWGVLVPSAHLEWEHEFKDDGRLITAHFVEDPTSAFSIPTDNPDRDYFKYGAALSATFPRGKSAYISYASVVGQNFITSSTIDLGGRMEF